MLAEPESELHMALNKPGHGMPLDLLRDTVAGLFHNKWIAAHKIDGPEFYPDIQEVESILRDEEGPYSQMTYYSLTPLGGAVWEAFARPEWNYYISVGLDNGQGHAESINREWLEKYVSLYPKPEGGADFKIERLENWEAVTYKRFDTAWQATFRFKLSEYTHSGSQQDLLNLQTRSWMMRRWCRWQ